MDTGCDQNLMREHERRITETEKNAENAHERINEVVALVKEFTVEMRESNKNIAAGNMNVAELVAEVKALTKEISFVAKATEKHEEDIADIKDNMETKDTVLKLYTKIEDANIEYKKGQDAVMKLLRQQETALEEHKAEPAKEALAHQKALVKWLIAGFGTIVISILTLAITMVIFK